MKRLSLLSLKYCLFLFLFSLVALSLVQASEIGAFGPKKYIRTKGKPNIYTNTFSATVGTAVLRIYNGLEDKKPNKDNRVTSGVVRLNGEVLFTHNDFKHQTYLLEIPIRLLESNTLRVELESKPGSYLSLEIIQTLPDPVYDLQASSLTVHAESCPERVDLIAQVANIGKDPIPAGLKVSFYHGDPKSGGILLGTAFSTKELQVAASENIVLPWSHPAVAQATLFASVDDDGTGKGNYTETNEENNVVSVAADLCQVVSGDSSLSGHVIDAVTGQLLAGVHTLLYLDNNGEPGAVVGSTTSNGEGIYHFPSLPAGSYIVSAAHNGYIENHRTVTLAANVQLTNQDLVLSPVLASGEIRIILTWNASPADLEAHLTAPSAQGCRYHCYYFDKIIPTASLDLDDRNGYGPETITITERGSGTYRYYVHDFTNRYSAGYYGLARSGAVVKVFYGDREPVVFSVPNQGGTAWHVFDLDGSTGVITPVNSMGNQSEPGKIDYPEITSYPQTYATWNTRYTYQVKATDPDNDTLTYSLTQAPPGMAIDPATGLIEWTPSGTQAGYYSVTVKVDDGRCGEAVQQFSVYVNSYPSANFSVSPCSGFNPGGDIILTWSTTLATTVLIEPGIGEVAASGSITLPSPQAPTLYTLTAFNEASLTKRTAPTYPSASFYFSPYYINPGQSTTLQWNPQCFASAVIDHGIGQVSSSGSLTVTPSASDTYYLTLTNGAGTQKYGASFYIMQPPPPPAPAINFTISPGCNMTPGQPLTLSWSVANATKVTIEPDIGTVEAQGSRQVYPMTAGSYTLTATGEGGTARRTVYYPSSVPSIWLSSSSWGIDLGESVTLNWSVSCADTVSMNQGIGAIAPSGSITVTPATLPATYTITAANERGANTNSVTLYQIAPTATLSADPSIMKVGDSSTLTWTSTRASSCSISPDIGPVALNGSMTLTPTQPTVYTLTAQGLGGTRQSQVYVGFVYPMADLKASAVTINQGETVQLTWVYANATTSSINQGIGEVELGGERTVAPTTTTTYTMTAIGPGGTTSDSVTINVIPKDQAPVTTLAANPGIIPAGGSTTLSWNSNSTDTLSIEPGIGVVANSGSMTVSPATTTTYTATATGPGGATITRTLVQVVHPKPTLSLAVAPAMVTAGEPATLSWTSTNADAVTLDHGLGIQGPQGSITITPNETTLYTATAKGPGGTVSRNIAVQVQYPPPTVDFTASPSAVKQGQNTTLSWNTENARTVVIKPGIGTVNTNGSVTVAPTVDTTYIITVAGVAETVTKSVFVAVYPELSLAVDTPINGGTVTDPNVLVSGRISTGAKVLVNGAPATVSGTTFNAKVHLDAPGLQNIVAVASDDHGQVQRADIALTYVALPMVSLSADKQRIAGGESVQLTWHSEHCETATLNPGIGRVDCNGSRTLTPTATTEYSIQVTGLGKTAQASLVIVVDDPFGEPTAEEQAHLEAINRARANPPAEAARLKIDLNEGPPAELISASPLPPLTFNARLTRAARGHSRDMVANHYFAHEGSDGSSPEQRCTAEGYLSGCGENIAAITSSIALDSFQTSLQLHDDLFLDTDYPGRGHRINMLGEKWTEIGIGYVHQSIRADMPYGGVVTCNFGSGGNHAMLGVVYSDIDSDQVYDQDEGVSQVLIRDRQSGTAVYSASAGGYSLPLANGAHTIEVILPDGRMLTKEVVMAGANIKQDFRLSMFTGSKPTVSISSLDYSVRPGESTTLVWHSMGADLVEIDNGIGYVPVNGSIAIAPSQATTYTMTATGKNGTATASVTVEVSSFAIPPAIQFSASPAVISKGGTAGLTWSTSDASSVHIDNGIGNLPLNGALLLRPEHTTTYTLTATSPGGVANARVTVQVNGNTTPQPAGSFGVSYSSLIPADATINHHDPGRFSLLTGQIQNSSGAPLAGVTVSILGHLEYGTATSDQDGSFTLPVEGGTTLTVKYFLEGHLPAQRLTYVPVNDIAIASTVQLIRQDTKATQVTLDGQAGTVVTHRSSIVADGSGSRSLTMVFQGNNRAFAVDENGKDIRELKQFVTRATEYQTPKAMPAELPKTSSFTYCAELEIEGADRVRFTKPVVTWVNNFLGFAIGAAVPVGSYDRDKGVWVAAKNGVVVTLLDTNSDGVVDALDSDGDGSPNDLNGNGSFRDEVTGLNDPQVYRPGESYWRVEVNHFSPWDFNWCSFFELLHMLDVGQPKQDEQLCPDCPQSKTGSSTGNQSRIFYEDISIPGTGLSLVYASDRTEGYGHVITVPVTGSAVPASVKRILVNVEVAGRQLTTTVEVLPDQIAELAWDGKDLLGNRVRHTISAHVNIGYVYDSVYMDSGYLKMAFGQFGTTATAVPTRDEVVNWRRSELTINPGEKGYGLAQGWTLSAHHHLDPVDPTTLHKGDGSVIRNNTSVIVTVAGNGGEGWARDGAQAKETPFSTPVSTAIDSAGNLYVANQVHAAILKIDRNGVVRVVAGGINGLSDEDGIEATRARIHIPSDIAFDSRDNLYIADAGRNTIRKIDPAGIITTLAGNGQRESTGDEGPALLAGIIPSSIAVDDAGAIYFSEASSCVNGDVDPVTGVCQGGQVLEGSYRVRKISTDGLVRTIAGTGEQYDYRLHGLNNGDGGPASQAYLSNPSSVSVDHDGNLYIADGSRIRKVNASGTITSVAGNGTSAYTGDGGLAVNAGITSASGIVFDHRGNFYFSQHYGNGDVIRKVGADGYISTVAGKGAPGLAGDDGPSTRAQLMQPHRLSIDAQGFVLIPDRGNRLIRKVSMPSYRQQPIHFAEASGIGHVISAAGLHTATFDLETGAMLLEFGYNGDGQLTRIIDQFDNVITIEQTLGVPSAIISPDGWRTELSIDGHNQLLSVKYPDSNPYLFEYQHNNGLLTAKIEPNGNRFDHVFDGNGRVVRTTDQEQGVWEFTRTTLSKGKTTSTTTTPHTQSEVEQNTTSTGAVDTISTAASGEVTTTRVSSDGLESVRSSSCGPKIEASEDLDPWFGYTYPARTSLTTPGGLSLATTVTRAYTDANGDGLPETASRTVTVNGKATVITHNITTATRTVASPLGRTGATTYDPATLLPLKHSVPGLLATSSSYRADGKPESVTTGDRTTRYSYDTAGNLATITDPMGRVTALTDYDGAGRVKRVVRPDNSVLQFEYDQNGNLSLYRTAVPADNRFTRNQVNNPQSTTSPLNSTTRYEYNAERQLTRVTLPSGKTLVNSYSSGLLTGTTTSEGTTVYTYGCGDQVDTITRGAESLDYDCDASLVTRVSQGGALNAALDLSYTNELRLGSLGYAGATEAMGYDDDGLLTKAGPFTITRDSQNGLATTVSDGAFRLERSFNGHGEADQVEASVNGGSRYGYSLDRRADGRITTRAETVAGTSTTLTYTYDPLGRLRTVTRGGTVVEEYRYDANGNRTFQMNFDLGITGRLFTHSVEDHTLTAGSIAFEFDHDDRLAARIEGSQTTEYAYSTTGELLGVRLPDGTELAYTHDPLGRRIAKAVNGVVVERYLWSGPTTLLAVYNGSNQLIQRFRYADGRMPPAMDMGGASYYLHYDQVGSLRLVTDSMGAVVKRIDYDSFGTILADSNPAFAVPFGFAGGLHDRDTQLVRFGARDYLPEIGKWTAKDPIGFAGGDSNLFGYVENDPVNWVDPEGLASTYSGYATYYNLVGYKTASGAKFNPDAMAAAMTGEKVPKFGTTVTVRYKNDGCEKEIKAVVNDRGPFARGNDRKALIPLRPDPSKIIDLTPTAFRELVGGLGAGKVWVTVEVP